MVGDEEQAMGGADGPDDAGKIILETLRTFGLALRGPRSCCTATGTSMHLKSIRRSSIVTVFIHVDEETSSQSARAALIAMRLVHGTLIFHVTLRFAHVVAMSMDAPFEETRTT